MGNRVLLPALAKVAAANENQLLPKIGEIILAAPAVPNEEFAGWLDELDRRGLTRFTLYASVVDKAMMGGFLRGWGHVLAGYVTHGRPLIHRRVQSVDVSEAGTIGLTNLNHDVFASNPVMMEDIRQLLQKGQRPPDKRLRILRPRPSSGQTEYWYYSENEPAPRNAKQGSRK